MSKLPQIRVMIVDDHMMVRDGLQVFLSTYDDITVVGDAGSGREALRLCQELQPNVILMDMVMPEMDGSTAAELIRKQFPNTQIIALTSFSEGDLVQRAIQAGAIGYLHKDVHADRLAQAIRDAYHGWSTIDASAARTIFEAGQPAELPGAGLTPREREVLALLVDGKTNKEIADQLFISLSTARLHVSNILGKLGASNRTEAVSLAVQNHLLGK